MKKSMQKMSLYAVAFLVWQCGVRDFDPKSLLNTYRVVGIQASPPAIGIAETSTIKMWDFHPNDVLDDEDRPTTTYTWSLCPFSIGSLNEYKCEIDEIPLDFAQDLQEFDINPAALFLQLGMKFLDEFAMTSSMLSPEMSTFELNVLDVYLKVDIKVGDEPPIQAVKKLTIHFDDQIDKNANPRIDGIELAAPLSGIKTKQDVILKAIVDPSQVEKYTPITFTAEGQKVEEARDEDLILAWFTSAGSLEPAVTLLNTLDTTLETSEDAGRTRVFVTIRDGRGGIDVKFIDLLVEDIE